MIVVVGALIVCSLLRFFVGQMFAIPSPSMESTLLVGDKVVVQKITDFKRGDIVVFGDPGGWLRNAASPGTRSDRPGFRVRRRAAGHRTGHLVKRVIGMPGDKVICCDKQGRITVNGQALDETSYLYRDAAGEQVVSAVTFEVVVPKDRLFVMGDHRDESADSRCHLSDVSAGAARVRRPSCRSSPSWVPPWRSCFPSTTPADCIGRRHLPPCPRRSDCP